MFPCLSNATDKLDLLFTLKKNIAPSSSLLSVQATNLHSRGISASLSATNLDPIDATLFALYISTSRLLLTILFGIAWGSKSQLANVEMQTAVAYLTLYEFTKPLRKNRFFFNPHGLLNNDSLFSFQSISGPTLSILRLFSAYQPRDLCLFLYWNLFTYLGPYSFSIE
jgi:hypothetical protein